MKSLGDRMKTYEASSKQFLPRRMPVIIRIDGKAFSSYTRKFVRPFDEDLANVMMSTSKVLVENIMGAKIAYTQSDEISILLTNDDKLTTEAWFANNLQKIVSVSASIATAAFNEEIRKVKPDQKPALFDSRVFVLPKDEVNNYFLWRQRDATSNSIQMVAQNNFSFNELQNKSTDTLQDMLMTQKGINWNDLPVWQKRGSCVRRTEQLQISGMPVMRSRFVVDLAIPEFSKDPGYIQNLMR